MTFTAKGYATRQRLLDAATAHLAKHGSIEVASIAEEAGVATSVLYRYFQGRDGLVAAVVSDFYDAYEEQVFARRDVPGKSWPAREAVRLQREIDFFYDHPLGRAVACGLLVEPAAVQVDATRTRAHGNVAARNIRAGQRSGELPSHIDAGLAGAAIIGGVRAMLSDALARSPAVGRRKVVAAAIAIGTAVLGGGGMVI